METISVPLDMLVPDPDNPRAHPPDNIDAIAKSLSRFGQVSPLVVHGPTSVVVGGNGTVAAMRKLGWDSADVVEYNGTVAEARALSVVLNRTAELAQWDADALGRAVASLRADGFEGLDALGFSAQALDDFQALAAGDAIQAGDVDPAAEWEGMPEYQNEDKTAYRSLLVHFKDEEAFNAFVGLVGCRVTDKTKMFWYPEIEIDAVANERWQGGS